MPSCPQCQQIVEEKDASCSRCGNTLRRELAIPETAIKAREGLPAPITIASKPGTIILREEDDEEDIFNTSPIQLSEEELDSFTWPSKLELKKWGAYDEFQYSGANPKRLIARIEEFIQDLGYTVRPKAYSEEKEFLDEVMSMKGGFHGAKAALKKEKKPPLIPAPRSIKVGLIIGILLSFAGVVVSLTEGLVGQSLPLLSAIPSDITGIGVPTWIPGALFITILILSWYKRPFETLLTQELVVLFEGQLSKGTRVRSMEEKVQEMPERSGGRGMTIQETYIMSEVDIRFAGKANHPERTDNVQNDLDRILNGVRTVFSG